jgi:hypothetical protein
MIVLGQFQVPFASNKAVHNTVLPSLTVTVEPASLTAVPEMLGVLLLVLLLFAGSKTTGATGATVSFRVFFESVPVPAPLV